MLSAKWQPFCSSLSVVCPLAHWFPTTARPFHSLRAQHSQQFAVVAVQGAISGLWKLFGIPTNHVSSLCIASYLEFSAGERSPIYILYQHTVSISSQLQRISYPTDSHQVVTV